MTKARRLIPMSEVTSVIELAKQVNLNWNHIDIRSDGITLSSLPTTDIPAKPVFERKTRNAHQKWQEAQDA
jgi:hypothetical protein